MSEQEDDTETRRLVACAGKDALSAGQARKIARRMNAKKKGVNPYRCTFCGQWHVGRMFK